MNDRFYDSASESASKEDDNNNLDDHLKNKKSFINDPLIFAGLGMGLIVVVIFIGWIFLQKQFVTGKNQIIQLGTRIEQFEDRLAKIKEIGEQISRLEMQLKEFAPSVERIDRFATSLSLRLDTLTRKLESQGNKTVEIKAADTAAPKTIGPTSNNVKIHYHVVQIGETLYKISRQYGLSVDELRRINKLESNTKIYPGQKLIVSPGKKNDE